MSLESIVQTAGSKRTIERLTFTPIPEPLEEVNAFTLGGKGFSQYAALLLAIFAVLFCAYAFVQCIRAKALRKQWFWLVLIPTGVCKFTVNWTTGEGFFTPLSIYSIPGSAFCAPYGPWMVNVSIPLGAIAFLLRRRRLATIESEEKLRNEAGSLQNLQQTKAELARLGGSLPIDGSSTETK